MWHRAGWRKTRNKNKRGRKQRGTQPRDPQGPSPAWTRRPLGGRCKLQSTPGLVDRLAQGRGWVSIPKELGRVGGGAGRPGQRHIH